jgi:hypothetical protein
MTVDTLGCDLPAAEICRRNDWIPGTVLQGMPRPNSILREPIRLWITAVGDGKILAVRLDDELQQGEWHYELTGREWRRESYLPVGKSSPKVPS